MNQRTLRIVLTGFTILWTGALTSCASSPPPCAGPQTKNLDAAMSHVKRSLNDGCAAHFERFYDDLLTIAEGDPRPENNQGIPDSGVRKT